MPHASYVGDALKETGGCLLCVSHLNRGRQYLCTYVDDLARLIIIKTTN